MWCLKAAVANTPEQVDFFYPWDGNNDSLVHDVYVYESVDVDGRRIFSYSHYIS